MIILLLVIVLSVIHDHCLRQEASDVELECSIVWQSNVHMLLLSPSPFFSLARVHPSRAEAQRALFGDLSIESAITVYSLHSSQRLCLLGNWCTDRRIDYGD